MDQHWVFDDVAESDRKTARQRWNDRFDRLEKLLRSYEPDKISWRMTLSHIERGNRWQFRVVVLLPTGTLVAQSVARTLEEAIDDAAETMRREVKKHRELVRRDYLYRRRRQVRENLSAAGSYLEQDVAETRREAFFRLLQPYLGQLKKEIGQQLRFLANEGLLKEHGLTVQDVVDDILVRAWEEYSSRPKHLALDLWLTQLAQQRLRKACQEPEEAVLSESVEPKTTDEPLTPDEDVDEPEYWLERFEKSYLESSWEDLIPDEDTETAQWWAELDADERRAHFEQALSKLPGEQRDVVWLSVVSGYDVEEVGQILGEDPDKIRSLLDGGLATLREFLGDVAKQQKGHAKTEA